VQKETSKSFSAYSKTNCLHPGFYEVFKL